MPTQLEVQEGARTEREGDKPDKAADGKLRDWEVDQLGTIHGLPSPSEEVWKPEPANLEDELYNQQQQEFEEQQQQDRLQAVQNAEEERKNSPVNQVADAAKQVAKNYVKNYTKEAAVSAIASTAPIWGPILGVLAVLAVFIGLVVMAVTSVKAVCDGGYTSSVDNAIARVAVAWIPGDVCAQLATTNVTAPTTTTTTTQAPSGSSDEVNRKFLVDNGISINNPYPTTSLLGMRQQTLTEIVNFKQACNNWSAPVNCTVVVTGGTEDAHAEGVCSHQKRL
jgi:hypothetical protein